MKRGGILALARVRLVLGATAVVVVALLLVSVAVFTGFFRKATGPTQAGSLFTSSAPIESYYFQAHIESDDANVLDTVRAWYQSPDKWRFEFGDFASGIPDRGSMQVSDGKTVSFYEADTNTYSRQPVNDYLSRWPSESRGAPIALPISLPIGPLASNDPEAYFRSLTASWTLDQQTDGPDIAGQPSELYRYSVSGTGEVSLWLDRASPVILRFETNSSDSPQGHLLIEITDLALNQPVDATRFSFEPPQGAIEVAASTNGSGSSSSSTLSSSGRSIDAPKGFFAPAYLPPGFTVKGESTSTSGVDGQTTTGYVIHLQSETGAAHLDIDQQYRAGGLAQSQRSGDAVQIGDATGYQRTEGSDLVIVWSEGDIVITLRSNQLSAEELVRVGESMQAR